MKRVKGYYTAITEQLKEVGNKSIMLNLRTLSNLSTPNWVN